MLEEKGVSGLLRLKSQIRNLISLTESLVGHAVNTYQPGLDPVQALLAEPKVGVSIAASSAHGDHSLVPVSLYPDHGGGPEAFSQWY